MMRKPAPARQREMIQAAEGDNVASILAWPNQYDYRSDAALPILGAAPRVPAGHVIDGLTLSEAIPDKHKVALRDIAVGETVVRYGFPIGTASSPIPRGSWVHTHNVAFDGQAIESVGDRWEKTSVQRPRIDFQSESGFMPEFEGYRRANGRAGCRNYLALVSLVGCISASMDDLMRDISRDVCRKHRNIDGVLSLSHNLGCSQVGPGLDKVRNLIVGLARNPNIGGIVFVELGCQNLQMTSILEAFGEDAHERIRSYKAQEAGDERVAISKLLYEVARVADKDRRESIPLQDAVIGVKCGGSDGLSGLTANRLCGTFGRRFCGMGGTLAATETGEMIGCEELLIQNSVSPTVAQACLDILKRNRDYLGEFYAENPSPGNIAGGLTNIRDKSLGAIAKFLPNRIVEVRDYAEGITPKLSGVSLVYGPCNDEVSVTNLFASGCILTIFTTGQGTNWGGFGPTFKVSSNSRLAEAKPHWIDFNAGRMCDVDCSPEEIERDFWNALCDCLSGRSITKAEKAGFFKSVPWQYGQIL